MTTPSSKDSLSPTQYRKKPVVIEAMQWTGDTAALASWLASLNTAWEVGDNPEVEPWQQSDDGELDIATLEGTMRASMGDWIIKGVKGEFYPCKPDIFALTYEVLDGGSPSALPPAVVTEGQIEAFSKEVCVRLHSEQEVVIGDVLLTGGKIMRACNLCRQMAKPLLEAALSVSPSVPSKEPDYWIVRDANGFIDRTYDANDGGVAREDCRRLNATGLENIGGMTRPFTCTPLFTSPSALVSPSLNAHVDAGQIVSHFLYALAQSVEQCGDSYREACDVLSHDSYRGILQNVLLSAVDYQSAALVSPQTPPKEVPTYDDMREAIYRMANDIQWHSGDADPEGRSIPRDVACARAGFAVGVESALTAVSPQTAVPTSKGDLKMDEKTLHNTDISGARKNVKDIVFFGNGDLFKLICKVSSEAEGWMKSTKAMDTGNGCVVQVTTQQRNADGSYAVAEALTFVPRVSIQTAKSGYRYLAQNADD